MTAANPDKWYFVVTCRNPQCGRPVVICEAPKPLLMDVTEFNEIVELPCMACRTQGRWTLREIHRMRATPETTGTKARNCRLSSMGRGGTARRVDLREVCQCSPIGKQELPLLL